MKCGTAIPEDIFNQLPVPLSLLSVNSDFFVYNPVFRIRMDPGFSPVWTL